ncbi:helix-turn-helix domain-containing protein [uncultured Sunxiuqinia sp.]
MPSFESLNELEKHHVLQILDKYNWNISVSAKALKIDRVTLYNKIKKYNLKQSN